MAIEEPELQNTVGREIREKLAEEPVNYENSGFTVSDLDRKCQDIVSRLERGDLGYSEKLIALAKLAVEKNPDADFSFFC